jgi:hypothetical protein
METKKMATDAEPPIRDQLIEARKRILAQLDEMEFRATAPGFARRGGGPPDYRSLIAELEGELREINTLLDNEDSPNA